ncbi:MAG: galactose mutarotase [Rhodobacteraceae bacterium]|nr:galactose mutarotase [Paracoccaceae bacterium]
MSNPLLRRVVLRDKGVAVTLLNYGAITQSWTVGGVPMVRALTTGEDYLTDQFFTGIIAGRVANRTASGRFSLNGARQQLSQNDGPHHLHGGVRGLGKRFWEMEPDGPQAVRLSYHSPEGEEGYPATVDFTVNIHLSGHTLTYEMAAEPDRPTPINLTQHNYYTLGGTGPIWGAKLALTAEHATPANAEGIPSGEIVPVAGTSLDFRTPRALSPKDAALDANLLFSKSRAPTTPVATLCTNGYRLQMWSDQPGLQLYTGAHLPAPNTAICLEPQAPPNALNQPDFPSIIATPAQPYRQVLRVKISKATR